MNGAGLFKSWRLIISALLLAAPPAAAAARPPARTAPAPRWVVAGPFTASGDNALFKDYLAAGGEARARARAGDVAGTNGATTVRWQAAPGAGGEVDFASLWPDQRRAVAYAFTEIESPAGRPLVATIGCGSNVQVRLNGQVVYESRLSRKPEPDKDTLVLRPHTGRNTLLVKVEGGRGDWKLRLKTHEPPARLFVNRGATVIPDFRAGERAGAWGQVEVANAGTRELNGVAAEVLGDELVLPSRSAPLKLAPGEVQRIPFWVAGRAPAPQTGAKPIRLRVTAGGEEETLDFTPRVRKAAEYFVTTYRSFVDGSVQPYSVLLPASYDPARTYPLVVLLHGANVTDWAQNIISYEPKEWAIQVAVHDRGNNRYRDIGEVDLDEVLSAAKGGYRIDEERVYLSGHSMGGYGTWFQATRRPDRWAAISPQAGYADYFIYHPAMREGRGNLLRPFQRRLLEHWSPLLFAENLLHVPAYVVHGAKDDNVSVEHSRRMAARLRELGYAYVYDENPEGGHWWGPRGTHYGVEVVDKPAIWDFLRKQGRRARLPQRVVYTTDTLRYNEAYWVRVDEFDRANGVARIEAELTAPDAVSVRLDNITQFTLKLDGLVSGAAANVAVNGAAAFRGPLPASKQLTLRREAGGGLSQVLGPADVSIACQGAARADTTERVVARLDRAGSAERVVARVPVPLRKSGRLYGPIGDAFNAPFLLVTGTARGGASDAAMREASRRAAEALARDWMGRAGGVARVKRDADVTRDDVADYNLILFGNPRVNRLIAQVNGELPVRFKGGGVAVGGGLFEGEDVGTVLVWPNPLNPDRYVVVVGATTPRGMETAARLRFGELPDYVVFDRRALEGEETEFVAGGFFDKFWRLEPAPAAEGAVR